MNVAKFGLCITLAGLVLAGCAQDKNADSIAKLPIAAVDQAAPEFDMPAVGGKKLDFASLKGKAVYLNFFATWCTPCNDEAPDINALQQRYASAGLQVVGVDVLENEKKAASFVALHHLTYPAVIDDGRLRDAYRINGMPVHVFIDRKGIVRKIEVGQISKAEMVAQVRAIL